MAAQNTQPDCPFSVLKRMLNANWKQLANRLGVTPLTLRTWRDDWQDGNLSTNAQIRARDLFRTTLRNAQAEWLAD